MLSATLVLLAGTALAQSGGDIAALAINPPIAATAPVAAVTSGRVDIVVRLVDKPLAAMLGDNAKHLGSTMSKPQQQAYLQQLNTKQSALMASIAGMGGREITRLSKASNAVVVSIDAKRVADVARLAGVAKVRRVTDYQLDLSETVPYIGAKALQLLGIDGTGVRVAVLDSGIDYTHRNLYGPGTLAAYTAAYGASTASTLNKTRDGLFPTAKVVDGYDFVGEVWPNGPLAPDNDPIDCSPTAIGCGGGHGTHVADIIAGKSLDGTHVGVAPGAKLLAVKVCSAVATSCSGIALLQAVDFALDPNGDGDMADAVDVMNLSLGSNYGQREDDLTYALGNASRFGVVVVAAAGNAADRPFIASSPANAPEVISVAQTQVPSAEGIPLVINSPPTIAGSYPNTATLDFAPVGAGVTGNVAFVGRGCPADAYLADPAGKIALIDRGTCAVSLKIDRAVAAGATGVLIGLVAAGDAITFSYGGGTHFAPSLVITLATANVIKANIAAPVNATLSDLNAIALAGSMVGSSARGPGYSYVSIKPDIGAPGASLSAEAGTGTGESVFGGTSGATPMVAGSAALLLQAFPVASPVEIKARLMNSAETTIYTNPQTVPGQLAPISRIGGGEVRVDRARALMAAAWDAVDPASVGLSFGYTASTATQVLRKKVLVRNYAGAARTFAISSAFRYANDAASAAIAIGAPPSITVPANGSATFTMALTVTAANLPTWTINGGSQGGNGPLLNTVEYDGYVTLSEGADTFHLPWHLLPHKAATTKAATTTLALNGMTTGLLGLSNIGAAIAGRIEAFALTGTSPQLPAVLYPQPGDNYALIDLKSVGVRLLSVSGGVVQFAVNTWGNRSHPAYPAEFDIYIDSNNDGVDDYVVFNSEFGGFGVTGQTVVNVYNLATGTSTAFFYADADLVSGNIILTAPQAAVGLTPATKFRYSVYAFDNYFSGFLTDSIVNMVFTGGTPRYFTSFSTASAPVGFSGTIPVTNDPAGATASPSQTGLLLMYRDLKPGAEADAVTITP